MSKATKNKLQQMTNEAAHLEVWHHWHTGKNIMII